MKTSDIVISVWCVCSSRPRRPSWCRNGPSWGGHQHELTLSKDFPKMWTFIAICPIHHTEAAMRFWIPWPLSVAIRKTWNRLVGCKYTDIQTFKYSMWSNCRATRSNVRRWTPCKRTSLVFALWSCNIDVVKTWRRVYPQCNTATTNSSIRGLGLLSS